MCCVEEKRGDAGDTAKCRARDGIARVESDAERLPPDSSGLCCVEEKRGEAGDAAERRARVGIAGVASTDVAGHLAVPSGWRYVDVSGDTDKLSGEDELAHPVHEGGGALST